MAWINLRNWKRREHYTLFRSYQHPFFSITVDVDVTPIWRASRKRGAPPFFITSLFLMLKAVNEVEAFRLRLRGRRVWRHDRVAVGPTVLRDDGTFGFVRLEATDDEQEFVDRGVRAVAQVRTSTRLEPMQRRDDIVFHSVLPWLRFTGFTNALPGGSDSIPRIVFGKCTKAGNRMMMPVAVEVHHALVDGLDVAQFLARFSALCRLARKRK